MAHSVCFYADLPPVALPTVLTISDQFRKKIMHIIIMILRSCTHTASRVCQCSYLETQNKAMLDVTSSIYFSVHYDREQDE